MSHYGIYFYTLVRFQALYLFFCSGLRSILNAVLLQFSLNFFAVCLTIKSVFLKKILFFLQRHTLLQFSILTDLACVDHPGWENRFELVYILLSVRYAFTLYVRFLVTSLDLIDSVYFLFPSASGLEREVGDLFGIFFFQHPDLRRILTDYGFSGHPLRKDFPLSGFLEVYYSDAKKKIVYMPISLAQEYRNYFVTNSGLLRKH